MEYNLSPIELQMDFKQFQIINHLIQVGTQCNTEKTPVSKSYKCSIKQCDFHVNVYKNTQTNVFTYRKSNQHYHPDELVDKGKIQKLIRLNFEKIWLDLNPKRILENLLTIVSHLEQTLINDNLIEVRKIIKNKLEAEKRKLKSNKDDPDKLNLIIDSFSILSTPLLIKENIKINQKNRRLENEKELNCPNDFISQEYDVKLMNLMSSLINKSYVDIAYSNDITKFDSLFKTITATFKSEPFCFYEVTDLWLKWILIRNIEMNNYLVFNNMVFEFIKNIFYLLKENECFLHCTENKILLEILVSQVFSINPQTKSRAKLLLADYTPKLIQFDTAIEILYDKFNLTTNDLGMKTELVDLIKIISQSFSFDLSDKSKINIFKKIYDNLQMTTKDQKMTKTVLEIIRQCYAKCEPIEKSQVYQILKGIEELNDLAEKKISIVKVPVFNLPSPKKKLSTKFDDNKTEKVRK